MSNGKSLEDIIANMQAENEAAINNGQPAIYGDDDFRNVTNKFKKEKQQATYFIPEVSIKTNPYSDLIDYRDPRVKKAQKTYEYNLNQLDKDQDKVIDVDFEKNIKKVTEEIGVDRRGDQNRDVTSLVTIPLDDKNSVVRTTRKDGDVKYHYTEESEKYKKGIRGWLQGNKANKEDIKLFEAQEYMADLDKRKVEYLRNEKGKIKKLLIDPDQKIVATAIEQIKIDDVTAKEAENKYQQIQKRIQDRNKKAPRNVVKLYKQGGMEAVLIRYKELAENKENLNKKQTKELEHLTAYKDDLYVLEDLNEKIRAVQSAPDFNKTPSEGKEFSYNPTDYLEKEKELLDLGKKTNDNAIENATETIEKELANANSDINLYVAEEFEKTDKLNQEDLENEYLLWQEESASELKAIEKEVTNFENQQKILLEELKPEQKIKIQDIDVQINQLRTRKYYTNDAINKANIKIRNLQEEKNKILEPIDAIIVGKLNEQYNSKVSELWKSSERYKNLSIKIDKRIVDTKERATFEADKMIQTRFQDLISENARRIFEINGSAISEKEFEQINNGLEKTNYFTTNDSEEKRKILDRAWSVMRKQYEDAGLKNISEKREAFYFKYYADIMYTKQGDMSSAAIKDTVKSILQTAPIEADKVKKEFKKLQEDYSGIQNLSENVAYQGLTLEETKKIREKYKDLQEKDQEWDKVLDIAKDVLNNPSYGDVEDGFWLSNLFSAFTNGSIDEYLPFISGIVDISEAYEDFDLSNKEEELTSTEKLILSLKSIKAEQGAKFSELSASWAAGTAFKEMIPWVMEIYLTGGISAAARLTAQKSIQRVIKAGIKSNIHKLSATKGVVNKLTNAGIKSLSGIFSTLAQSAAGGVFNVTAGTIEAMTPEMQLMYTTEGKDLMYRAGFVTKESVERDIEGIEESLQDIETQLTRSGTVDNYGNVTGKLDEEKIKELQSEKEYLTDLLKKRKEYLAKGVTYSDKTFNQHFLEKFGSNWAEYFSERLGGLIPNFGIKGAFVKTLEKNGPEWLQRTLMGQYLKKKLGKNFTYQDAIKEVLTFTDKKIMFDGLIGEIFEEIANQPIQNLISGEDWDEGFSEQFFKEITNVSAVAQVAFGGVSAGFKLTQKTPSFNFNGKSFDTYQDMMKSVKDYSKKSWKKDEAEGKEFPKINISNDNTSFIATARYLEENNISVKSLINEDVEQRRKDRNLANEAKIIDLMHEDGKGDQVKELEKIDKEITEINEKVEDAKTEESKSKLRRKKKALENKKEIIISPYLKQIVTQQFEADVENVRKGVKQIDDVTGIETRVEVTDDAGVKQIVRQDMLEELGIVIAQDGKYLKEDTSTGEFVEVTGQELREVNNQVNAALDKSNHGFIGRPKAGKRTIVINRDNAIAGGAYNVASHEFLHAVLFKTLNDNPATQLAVGQALGKYLQDLDLSAIKDTDFLKRVMNYQKTFGEGVAAEEIITLFSDGLRTGDIQYNETKISKVGDIFRRVMSRSGVELSFRDGRDIFNFVKDFNYNLEKGNWTEIAKAAKGIKLEGEIKQAETFYSNFYNNLPALQKEQYKLSKDPKALETFAQNIYDDPSLDLTTKAFLISRLYDPRVKFDKQGFENPNGSTTAGGIRINKELKKYEKLPDFSVFKDEIIDDIINGLPKKKPGETDVQRIKRGRSILSIVANYDPNLEDASGNRIPVTGWIGSVLSKRGISESVNKFIKEDAKFKAEITETKELVTKETKPDVKTETKPKQIVLADRLGVTKEVSETIKKIIPSLNIDELTFKNLKNKVPAITGKLFGISPKKLISLANITKKELQTSQMFINKNADLLIKMLPEGATEGGVATGVPKTLLKEFYIKGERAKMAKTGTKAGLAVQQKKSNIDKKQFLEVFGIIDGKPVRTDRNTSARVLALANTLGKMITNQAIRQEVRIENFRALEDGKSIYMFSKGDRAIAEEFGQGDTYYEIEDLNSVEQYVDVDVPKIVKVFEKYPGLISGNELVNGLNAIKNPELKKALRDGVKGITKKGKYPKRDFAKFVGNTVEQMKNEAKINEFNKQAGINFDAHWTAIDKALYNDPTLLGPILIYLSNAVSSKTHVHRSGAEFIAYDNTVKGKLYLEHALQNVNAYRTLIRASMNDKTKDRSEFKKALKALKENYKLIGVSVADNKKLDDSGYKLEMPKNTDGSDWNIFKNSWWQRYSNEKINDLGGINFENFNVIGSKNNLAQEYNIPVLKPYTSSNKKLSKAVSVSRIYKKSQGITILDFDDTLATTESLVKYTAPDGKTGTLNAEQFASTYQDLQDQGYTFDFSDFNKVVKGKLAPLFNKALKLQKKFGPENMFVLTARPPAAQKAIFDFLKANGLNIPLKNITGLGNSTSEAKALWVADKVAEGYNDFYFADDALQNVQAVKNMLDQFDVKSKVQQAKYKFSVGLDKDFNDIIESVTGIESIKEFSKTQAKIRGKSTKYKSIIPPSAQDFIGLIYSFLGKGAKGEADFQFFKKALIDPFARGINELNTSRQKAANDLENLNKKLPEVKKKLYKKVKDLNFTNDMAMRVYLWNKAGFEVPGLSKRDQKALVKIVENDSSLKAYADSVSLISKKESGYRAPKEYWLAENIASDLLDDGAVGDARSLFLNEFIENKNIIFSEKNLNKIEAIYGSKFREALVDMLYRMETGRTRSTGSNNRLLNMYNNWVNNSVGAIMFFNMRSALLQTISATNYVNWSDNNPLKAAAAFANQKQYWKDFSFIFNSDFLKQRRTGNRRGINEQELSAAVAGSDNKAKAAIAWLLSKGFLPTQIADSFAIASGGATFYRNRIKKYVKEGLSEQEAQEKAFLDFQEVTEASQQSARADMISQQQASPLGRLILAFQNTPMQYARIINKSARDLNAGRGDFKTHVSKIIYYGFAQGIIFSSLQQALFASIGDDEEEDFDKKKERILNSMMDSLLSGIGFGGKAISTVKNTTMTYLDQRDRGFRADHAYTLLTLTSFSPPIGSKLRKVYQSIKTDQYNKDVYMRRGFTLDNPIWGAIGNVIEGVTNLPLGRMSNKMLNIDNALDESNKWWQRIALVMGWNTWDLGIKDPDIEEIKKEIKKEKRDARNYERKRKREEKKIEKQEAEKAIVEENKKKSKEDGRCAAISKSGNRCKREAINGGFCTVHEKAEAREDGKKVQCKKVKSNGKRCKMQTTNKSGLCYYHD